MIESIILCVSSQNDDSSDEGPRDRYHRLLDHLSYRTMNTMFIDERNMSASEKEAFFRVVYGTTEFSSEAFWRRARSQFVSAMELLSHTETATYKEAMQKVPTLVELESSPIRFLRFENYNPFAAAKRLAAYWRHRKALFGERAFLPMTQTGEGALSQEDVKVLNTGYVVVLPSDIDRTPTMCYDLSRLDKDFDDREGILMPRLRCVFYIYSMVAENELAQTDGFVSLCVVNGSFGVYDFDFPFMRLSQQLIGEAMPLRRKRIHLVIRPPRSGKKNFFEVIFPKLTKLATSLVKAGSFITHAGQSKEDTVRELKSYGIHKSRIPRSLGGKSNDNYE